MKNKVKLIESFSNKNNAHLVCEFSLPDERKGTLYLETTKNKDDNSAVCVLDGLGSTFGCGASYQGQMSLKNAQKALIKDINLNSDDLREIVSASILMSLMKKHTK